MRTTYIQSMEVKRTNPYDPDFHGMIDYDVDIDVHPESNTDKEAKFHIKLKFIFTDRDAKKEYGSVIVDAWTTITTAVPLNGDGKLDMDSAPENFKRLVEGAVLEDVILPVSAVARQAKLPSLVPSPLLFDRPELHHHHDHGKGEEE